MNIPTGESSTDYTFSPDDVSFRLVTGPTREQLREISPRHVSDYEDFKTGYVGWFLNAGKNPTSTPEIGARCTRRPPVVVIDDA